MDIILEVSEEKKDLINLKDAKYNKKTQILTIKIGNKETEIYIKEKCGSLIIKYADIEYLCEYCGSI